MNATPSAFVLRFGVLACLLAILGGAIASDQPPASARAPANDAGARKPVAEAATRPAQPLTAADLTGWWRADLAYNGQRAEIFVRFTEKDGKPQVHFTLPPIQAWDFAAGGATLSGEQVQFAALPLKLTYDRPADTLAGVLPPDFAPAQKIDVAFRRSSAPELPDQRPWTYPQPKVQWTYQADGPVWAGLAHDARRRQVLVATDTGSVHALNQATGKLRWSHSTGGKVRARPVIEGADVYVNSDDGYVYKLDARTGRQHWRTAIDTRPEPRAQRAAFDRYGSAALVRGGTVYVGSVDGNLYALDAATGQQRWRAASRDKVYASPIAVGETIVFGSFDGSLYAVAAADGGARWQHDTRGPIVTAPALAGEHIIVGNRAFELTGRDARTGAEAWRHYLFLSWVDSVPTAVDENIYVGSSDAVSVMAFGAANGRLQWSAMLGGWCWAQPAVVGDRVYAGVSGGATPLGPRRGALVALDRSNGAIVWAYEVKSEGEAWGFAAAPAAAGERVYAADVTGTVYAF